MPEPFKNLFNEQIISGMGDHFLKAWPDFDWSGFVQVATDNLQALELKARSEQITQAMSTYLPDNFAHAGEIILASLTPEDVSDLSNIPVNTRGISGWAVMPMAHYVGRKGIQHFELSMTLLKEMTIRFSSEFGIRVFLIEKAVSRSKCNIALMFKKVERLRHEFFNRASEVQAFSWPGI